MIKDSSIKTHHLSIIAGFIIVTVTVLVAIVSTSSINAVDITGDLDGYTVSDSVKDEVNRLWNYKLFIGCIQEAVYQGAKVYLDGHIEPSISVKGEKCDLNNLVDGFKDGDNYLIRLMQQYIGKDGKPIKDSNGNYKTIGNGRAATIPCLMGGAGGDCPVVGGGIAAVNGADPVAALNNGDGELLYIEPYDNSMLLYAIADEQTQPMISEAAWYLIWDNYGRKQCGKVDPDTKGDPVLKIPVNKDGKITVKDGRLALKDGTDFNTKKNVFPTYKDDSGDATCRDIIKELNNNVDGYKMEAQAFIDASEGEVEDGSTTDSDSTDDGGGDSADEEEDPCQAGLLGFGWLFCPGANLLDSFLNGFLNEIDDQLNWTFLVDHSSEIKSRWQQFVNIANIIFAIAFLIMIYSMATSTGLSNYDVKKILPRLIVIAIAVNTSFYICGALVDASNIAGEGLYTVMSGGIGKWAPSMGMDGLLGVTTNVVLIVGCIFIFGIAAIVALAIILVCVTARQIALIVLICISPVAFACYLLPNTTKWFQKWLDYFTKLLLVYPMYAAVWGAAKWIGSMPADAISIGPFAFITQAICMIAPAMAIIPLFKMSGGIMGAVAARAAGSGLANRGHAAQKWMRGKGAGVAKNNFATRGITKRVSNAAGGFAVNHIGDERKGIRGGLNRWAGRKALGVANAAGAHAQSIDSELQALDSSAMSAAQTKIAGYSDDQLMSAITDSNTDQYTARAAMEKLGENMNQDQVREMLTSVAKKTNGMGPGHEREAQALRDAAYKAAVTSKSALVSNKSLQSFRNGNWGKSNGKSVEAEYTSGVIDYASKLSADSLSGLSASEQGYIRQTLKDASSNGVSGADDAIKSFRNASETAANDPKLLSKMDASAQKALSDNQDLRTSSDTTAAQNLGLDSARSALETAQSTYSQASQSGDATAIAKAQSLINDAERNIDGIGNKILSDPQAMGNFNNLHKADKQWINDQTLRISRKNNP